MAETSSAQPIAPPVEDPMAPSTSVPPPVDDWPKQATDAVVKVVDAVRDKTTGPAVNAAHALKYGIVLLFLAFVLGVVGLVITMRLCESIIRTIAERFDSTNSLFLEPMWLVYLLFGVPFCVIGLVLWRKANRPAKASR